MEFEEDRLSSLPKIILHHILSKLSEKDRARTRVLSKAWLETWWTFPILSFCDNKIRIMCLAKPMEDNVKKRKILGFCDYVKRRMLKFHDQKLAIKEFKLKMYSSGICHISKDVDIWLKLACECGVEVIEYSQRVGHDRYYYHALPRCVIEAKSLTKLVLSGFIKIHPIFMNYSIKFVSLRVLSVSRLLLGDEHAINHLVSFCPLIEYITLNHCMVLSSDGGPRHMKSLSISGLQKLKSVDVSGIKYVSIDAPSLENLCYYPDNDNYSPPSKIDFDRCRNLKELYLSSVASTFFTNKWFLNLFLKFPFLESLKLHDCKIPQKIDISSVRLKMLKLWSCSNLMEVNIDSPNLLSFIYDDIGTSKPTISFLNNSSQLEANIHIVVDYEDLCNLRNFMQNIQPHNVLTSLYLFFSDLDVVSSPPPSIKNLVIEDVPSDEYLFSSLVNILLSSCCPTTISFWIYSFSDAKAFIEFFYETLMRKKDDCFCISAETKCWWHGLKDVKVTSSMKIDENVCFKTILESSPAYALEENITFRLEF